MNTTGDAAEQIVRMSLNGVEVAARITGTGAKELAIMISAMPICGTKLNSQMITVLPNACQKKRKTSEFGESSLTKLSKPMMELLSTFDQPAASVSDVRKVKKIG